MALLRHEVWEEPDENGRMLETLCLAGPDGNALRATLGDNAILVATFKASSYVDAMTNYYFMYDRGEYVSGHQSDYDPYPDEWRTRKRLDCLSPVKLFLSMAASGRKLPVETVSDFTTWPPAMLA